MLRNIIMRIYVIPHFSKPTERTPLNPDVHCGLRVATLCQRRFVNCDHFAAVADSGGGSTRAGARGLRELCFLLRFAVKLELL